METNIRIGPIGLGVENSIRPHVLLILICCSWQFGCFSADNFRGLANQRIRECSNWGTFAWAPRGEPVWSKSPEHLFMESRVYGDSPERAWTKSRLPYGRFRFSWAKWIVQNDSLKI